MNWRIGRGGIFLLCALLLVGCGTTPKPKKFYGRKMPREIEKKIGNLAPRGIEDSLSTPPHNFSREEYPFDNRGNYREDWVTIGDGSSSGSGGGSRFFNFGDGPPRVRYHTVKKGDTLFGLSREYGVTLHSLRKTNKLKDYTIRIGQTLRIPASRN